VEQTESGYVNCVRNLFRGAELIQELSQKRIQEQHESERKVLEKIKSKMDRIKATQKKIQGFGIKEPESHEKGTASSSCSAKKRIFNRITNTLNLDELLRSVFRYYGKAEYYAYI